MEYIIRSKDNENIVAISSEVEVRGEIVRCSDCKYFDKDYWECNLHCIGVWNEENEADVIYRIGVEPRGYCSWGDRKEN